MTSPLEKVKWHKWEAKFISENSPVFLGMTTIIVRLHCIFMRLYSLQCDSTYIIFSSLGQPDDMFFWGGGGVEQDEVGKNSHIALPGLGGHRGLMSSKLCDPDMSVWFPFYKWGNRGSERLKSLPLSSRQGWISLPSNPVLLSRYQVASQGGWKRRWGSP